MIVSTGMTLRVLFVQAAWVVLIKPKSAAQKFHVLILWNLLDNSVTLSNSSIRGLMLGKRHIADVNQHAAEPHAAIIAAVSINDVIITPVIRGREAAPTMRS